jgi:hypothetical protein
MRTFLIIPSLVRCSLLVPFLLSASLAHAEAVWAIRPEPGLVCMATAQPRPQILDQPRGDALPLATAGPVVFAVKPQHVEAGYMEVERPNGQIGWVQQTALSAGPASCVPTLMSNGLVLPGAAR